MVCFDWPDVIPQTVAGESVTERVVPEPKALEEDDDDCDGGEMGVEGGGGRWFLH
jgi:hypothetical protein